MQKVSSSLIKSISASQILVQGATDGQVLTYSQSTNSWGPANPSGGGTSTGGGTLSAGVITNGLLLSSNSSSPSRLTVNNDPLGSGVFSTGNMLLGNNPSGPFFGNTSLTENQLIISESSIAQSWANIPNTQNNSGWTNIAASSDARYQTAIGNLSGIYVSTDYGNTWTVKLASPITWAATNMSGDGQYQIACSTQYLYVSQNFGDTWALKALAIGTTRNWSSVHISMDGRIQVACVNDPINGYVYMSTDFGNTWAASLSSIGARTWSSITTSSDGKYQTACVKSTTTSGHVFVSTDYGATWRAAISDQNRLWNHVDMSADGRYQTAVVDGGFIYVSSNFGATWTQAGISASWKSVTMSANGKIQLAHKLTSSDLYVSLDWGVNWNLIAGPAGVNSWVDTAMSSDAKVLLALESTKGVYRSFSSSSINGDVGIGTSAPLNVNGYTSLTLNSLTSGGRVDFTKNNNQFGLIYSAGPNLFDVEATGSSTAMRFNTNLQERMRISSDGNIGIGTDTPNYILDVLSLSVQPARFRNRTPGSYSEILISSDDRTLFIGQRSSTHPNGALTYFTASGTTPIAFFTNTVERLRINADGNVGIGTSSPQFNLDVNGVTKSTSFRDNAVSAAIGSSYTVNLTSGSTFILTLQNGTPATISLPTPSVGQSFIVFIKQPSSGSPTTATFSATPSVKWSGGSAPTITATLNKTDIISFVTDGGGWYGSFIQNF